MLIFKNETNVKITGIKTFENNFTVNNLIETEKLNGILVKNIFTKTGKQDVNGPILIKGDAVFKHLDVEKNVNQISLRYILDHLKISNNTYTIESKY